MHWVCLLLPHLALDAVLRRHPEPDRPWALIAGPAQRRVLHSVNPAARALGLRPGQSLAAAQAISSGFATAEYDPGAERRAHELLAAWAYRFSSQVSTQLPHAIVLEIGRSLKLFGPWPRLEARLREELHGLGFRHRLVAAPNPHAARVLANAHDGLGLTEATLLQGLGQLPVERAGFEREVAQALQRMGLRTLRQVFALPRDALARRFPRAVLAHLDAIRGEAPPLRYYRPPDTFEQRIEFEHEVESSQALLFPLRRLCADLAAYLAGRDGGVQRFRLLLEHERCADSTVEVGLLAPEREAAMLFELARGRLEQARAPAPVRGLRLLAHELPPFVPAERDLFDARPQQAVPWAQLRERLRARLGDDAVHGLVLQGDHRPEHAWSEQGGSTPLPAALPPRPGWLLPQPTPLRDHRLTVLAGPERIESGWWDGEVRRDYYLVETSSGQRAWAWCHPGERGPFMLHGWFA
ncbi:Y-family DNA polymerase [Vulcaniibacterium tengchongense]|uniref:Protein ImuB n=1 Tax=Vulcaniibacterium tengchongense TaxID=1273429 RepID=A0A3N4VDV9_9GAMM|nr:DNA polymerase Y family protein [Vulcaniibacterium tengchongense]RPE79983.1 protein ImuB [Vulcaniibacterium tengchongense]